jgi:ribosomal protein S7
MIRSIPRSLLWRSVSRTSSLNFNRPVTVARRQYAKRKPPSSNGQPISDFIASQSTPLNPETPSDRMPHQTEEDIAMERIFNEDSATGNEDGTPAEGVAVEDVFKEDPAAMDNAPQVITRDNNLVKATGRSSANQELPGHSSLPHVTEESIATERIMTGKSASGASNSTPGEETPAEGVPIEEVIGDGEKPVVMEESAKEDDDAPPSGQNLRTHREPLPTESTSEQDALDPTEGARKSILDLFGPASGKKARQPQPSPPSEPIKQQNFNPLSAHQLDESEIDLSAWEEARRKEEKITHEKLDPDEWGSTTRGSWKTEEVAVPQEMEDELDAQLYAELPSASEIRAIYNNKPRNERTKPYDLKIPATEKRPISPYDYFYPPPPPPKDLGTLLRRESQKRNPNVQKVTKVETVYDPFAVRKKQVHWPWMLNRDQLVETCTNHLMRHGKKATAEKILQNVFLRILAHYPRRHPVTLFAEAIDKNAPLLKNTSVRISMKQTIVPFALNEKQRIRAGWTSMIRAAAKGEERLSPFTERLANEVIKAFEGRGVGQQNRITEHKRAMQNKLNVKVPKAMKR